MTISLKSISGWLRPKTLAGQTILVVAASLFAVQLIGFIFYYVMARSQWVTIAAAPASSAFLRRWTPASPLPHGNAHGLRGPS